MKRGVSGKYRLTFKAGLNLFSLFQVHLTNWFKIEFICAYKLHINPLDLRELEFYEIEYLLKNFEEYIDEEEKQYKKQEKEYQKQYHQPSKSSIPKQQNYNGFKTPKVNLPNVNIPKLKF